MTVLITLTTAGTDSGPFNLYSDLDGYTSAFATGVSKSALVGGYSSSAVPDYTTIIRVLSTGVCTNYINITLGTTTTTSTSTSTSTTTTTAVPTTTSTTTECTCIQSMIIDVTEGGSFDYKNCAGLDKSIGVSPGVNELDFTSDGCFRKFTQTGSAVYTIVSFGPCCAETTTTTTTAVVCKIYDLDGGTSGRTFNYTNCAGVPTETIVPAGDSVSDCIRTPYISGGATNTGVDCP